MVDDQHPKQIAKYLLKGCCLLTEDCPNGKRIPLIRTKDGKYICVGCTPECAYYADYGDGEPAPPPACPRMPPSTGALPSKNVDVAASSAATRPAPPAADSVDASSSDPIEISFQGPELHFSCVRLVVTRDQCLQLCGDHYTVKARLGMPSKSELCALDTDALHGTIASACRQLAVRVLLPERNDTAEIIVNSGQIKVNCKDGSHFSFPRHACLLLHAAHVTQHAIAMALWEKVAASVAADVRWIEICVVDGGANEVTFRKSYSLSHSLSADVEKIAYDW